MKVVSDIFCWRRDDMKVLPKRIVLLALLVMLPLKAVLGQTEAVTLEFPSDLTDGTTISKERELKLLQLNEAKIALQKARNDLDRKKTEYTGMKELYDGEYVSGKRYQDAMNALETAQAAFETAEINLRRTKLSFLQNASRISVIEATQSVHEDGQRVRRELDFTLMNTSNVWEAIVTDEDLADKGKIQERLRIENILVTVLAQNIQIGKPFEIVIPSLGYGQQYKNKFVLQQTKIDSVQLRIEYLGKVDNRTVYMEKQSGEDIPRVTSMQFAQEGNAGGSVQFDLDLERLAEDAATFALEVVNLPDYIRPRFEEQGKMLSNVKFPERIATRKLNLRCYIPEEIAEEFLDKTISFFAVVGNEKAVKQLKALESENPAQPVTLEDIESRKIGYEALRLTPRGRPELRIDAPNLYFETEPDQPVDIRVVIKNSGTATLREVRLETIKSYDWIVNITPDLFDKIEPREEVQADITVMLPEGIGTGIYDLRAVVKCLYQGEPVQAPEKEFRISVKTRVNLALTIALFGAIVLAMAGLAVFTIRLARR
jgi:hypothetical protein